MKTETANLITAARIDELGALLKSIKELTDKADAIKDDIKDYANLSGDRRFEGDAYEALYIESNVSTVNWKKIAEELKIPAEIIAKHTKTAARFSLNVDAK
jgi:phosphoketolase